MFHLHTVWKGALSLGLLNIGIKLYSAVEENDIKFLSLHKECLTPIKYKNLLLIVRMKKLMITIL